jgi:hypothetical protein
MVYSGSTNKIMPLSIMEEMGLECKRCMKYKNESMLYITKKCYPMGRLGFL